MLSLNVPPRRKTWQIGSWKTSPCGGYTKGVVKHLSATGNDIIVQWKVLDTNGNFFCRIAISDGTQLRLTNLGIENEKSFVPLFPLDKSADSSGLFPCGLEKGAIEMKTVAVPPSLRCSNCILQLTWRTSSDIYYSCSDVSYPRNVFRYSRKEFGNVGLHF